MFLLITYSGKHVELAVDLPGDALRLGQIMDANAETNASRQPSKQLPIWLS